MSATNTHARWWLSAGLLGVVGCFPTMGQENCSDLSGCPDPVGAIAEWSRASLDAASIEVQTCVSGTCLPWVTVMIDGPSVSEGDWVYSAGAIVKLDGSQSDTDVRCWESVVRYPEGGYCLGIRSSRTYQVVDGAEISWRVRGVGSERASFEFGGVLVRRTSPLADCSKPEPACQYSDRIEYLGPSSTP